MKYKTAQNLLTFSYVIIFGILGILFMMFDGFLSGLIILIITFVWFIMFRIMDANDPYMQDDALHAISETEEKDVSKK